MRTRIWHSDWKPRWLIRCVSAALLSFMDKQEDQRHATAADACRSMDQDGRMTGTETRGQESIGPVNMPISPAWQPDESTA